MPNRIVDPPSLPLVAPSILAADFGRMVEECATVLSDDVGGRAGPEGATILHLDVMDGHFVPNLTMGPDMCRALRRAFPNVTLDAHLMVTDPEGQVEPFADAGADHITFHVEPALGILHSQGPVQSPPRYDPFAIVDRIRMAGMSAGLAVNPPTPAADALPFVEAFDLILVMSVHPGYSGQSFIPDVLGTVKRLRERLRDGQRVQIDGGITLSSAADAREAGCDVLVAASAVFGVEVQKRAGVIRGLRGRD